MVVVSERPTVLVIDDEPDLADLYAAWLTDEYEVRTAYGGDEALDGMDEDVDVALIDRLMPDLSGDEVLDRVREAGYNCRVAMVTAVEPDFDIIEMGFDDYLVKPVSREDLVDTVEQLLLRSEYDERIQQFFALASKKALLDSEKTEPELRASEEYARLVDRLAVIREESDEALLQLSENESYRQVLEDLS